MLIRIKISKYKEEFSQVFSSVDKSVSNKTVFPKVLFLCLALPAACQ